jgi:hypothetical protein
MSNDLLFSVIPRNNKVPVKSSRGVTKIKKDDHADRIKEEDKEKHREKQRADQAAMQKRHGKVIDNEDGDKKSDDDNKHLDIYI